MYMYVYCVASYHVIEAQGVTSSRCVISLLYILVDDSEYP